MRMKNIIITLALVGMTMMNVGCTALNHNRVKQNIIKDRIIASGSTEQLELLSRGVKPSEVIKISKPPTGQGAMLSVDLMNLQGFSGLMETFKEAPISSTIAGAADIVTGVLAVNALTGSSDSDGDKNNDGAISVNVSGNHNNTAINTGDGTTTVSSEDSTTSGEGSATSGSEASTSSSTTD